MVAPAPFFLDADSIRRQQAAALSVACARLHATMADNALCESPAHSCVVLAVAVCDALEGVGVRFANRDMAEENVAVGLWAGIATVSADAQLDGDQAVAVCPVFAWLAPVLHMLGAVAESVAGAGPLDVSPEMLDTFRHQLAAEHV